MAAGQWRAWAPATAAAAAASAPALRCSGAVCWRPTAAQERQSTVIFGRRRLLSSAAPPQSGESQSQSQSGSTPGGPAQPVQPPREKRWWDRIPGSLEDSHAGEARWWVDKLIICSVFAVTGSSTMIFVRPLLDSVLDIHGSMIDGPWSYRIAYIGLISPTYTALLLTFGALSGRFAFFKKVAVRMYGPLLRLLPKETRKKYNL